MYCIYKLKTKIKLNTIVRTMKPEKYVAST